MKNSINLGFVFLFIFATLACTSSQSPSTVDKSSSSSSTASNDSPATPPGNDPPDDDPPDDDQNPGVFNPGVVDYPIVYVRMPRYGDLTNTQWPDIANSAAIEPGSDLVILYPNGSEEVLVSAGIGAVMDPLVSFDAKWVFYSFVYTARYQSSDRNYQRRDNPRYGADIFKINLENKQVIQLTHGEWTPNTGAAVWASDVLNSKNESNKNHLGFGIMNTSPCELADGRIMFTSNRNSFQPNGGTYVNTVMQLFTMDANGKNVELVGHLNLGSALHPVALKDGRVAFSSYESQGIRDHRQWGLWSIWPDGRGWGPIFSSFINATGWHFHAQMSSGDIVSTAYYNANNNGFGTFFKVSPSVPAGTPPFGSPNPALNNKFQDGYYYSPIYPVNTSFSFEPYGMAGLTPFTHERDHAAMAPDGGFFGKVTHPAPGPNNDLLLVWTPGPGNNLKRPTPLPYYDGGIYLMAGGQAVSNPNQLIKIKNDPNYNEAFPRAVIRYLDIYGVAKPQKLSWLPNDGSVDSHLPKGVPFGLIGTSSFYKRDTKPGTGYSSWDGLDPFFGKSDGNGGIKYSSNWKTQGGDAGKYADEEIYAVRIVSMEPSTMRSYGPGVGCCGYEKHYSSHTHEVMRILGEIPLRKYDTTGKTILDPEGNPDTSFLAKIPADVPFTFQTLDQDGRVLNMSQTWHQVRPGEKRVDCGGCHAHSQLGLDFAQTAAAKSNYAVWDLTQDNKPMLSKNLAGQAIVVNMPKNKMDVEYYRDIKPVLQKSCVGCHSGSSDAAAELVLDDETMTDGIEGTWRRLCDDESNQFGYPSAIGKWTYPSASRYVRKLQSRRSLLAWKVFGKRLDGWSNADYPSPSDPSNPATLPDGVDPYSSDLDFTGTIMPPPSSGYPALSADEKIMFARWIDLGCPINKNLGFPYGWFLDELRPTLTIAVPRADNQSAVGEILLGIHDYYSGLNAATLSVKADFSIQGTPPGTELASFFSSISDGRWRWALSSPIQGVSAGTLTVSIQDLAGNTTSLKRTFSAP